MSLNSIIWRTFFLFVLCSELLFNLTLCEFSRLIARRKLSRHNMISGNCIRSPKMVITCHLFATVSSLFTFIIEFKLMLFVHDLSLSFVSPSTPLNESPICIVVKFNLMCVPKVTHLTCPPHFLNTRWYVSFCTSYIFDHLMIYYIACVAGSFVHYHCFTSPSTITINSR